MTRLDGKAIKAGSIPLDRLAAGVQGLLKVVSWSEPVVIDGTNIGVSLQLQDGDGVDIAGAHVLRVTCDPRALMAVGAHGVALTDGPTSDLIAKTDATGLLDIIVTCAESITLMLVAGTTQGSPMIDCSAIVEVAF